MGLFDIGGLGTSQSSSETSNSNNLTTNVGANTGQTAIAAGGQSVAPVLTANSGSSVSYTLNQQDPNALFQLGTVANTALTQAGQAAQGAFNLAKTLTDKALTVPVNRSESTLQSIMPFLIIAAIVAGVVYYKKG